MTTDRLDKPLWFIVYGRQDSVDIFPVHSEEPLTEEQVVQVIERHLYRVPEWEEEWIEIQGPCRPDVI